MADDMTDARPPERGRDHGTPGSTTSPYALYTTFPCAFGERYELLAELGRGGMGVVYQARDTRLKRTVALKVPTITDERWRAQFHKEAQAAAKLGDPNICRILDIDELNGQAYLSMEYIDGAPLSHRVRAAAAAEKPAYAPRAAAELVRTIARAMGKAHAANIVHRDLKPGNVMLARDDGRPVVLDFGLAVDIAADVPRETLPGTVVGTPSYMAPEQAGGRRDTIGPHTDVWALGVMLYELATGHRPFADPTVMQLLYKIVNEEPTAPRARTSAIKPELEGIILRCLNKDPTARYASGTELAAALDAYLNPPLSLDDPGPVAAPPKRKKWPLAAGAATVLLAVGVAAGVYFARDRAEPLARNEPEAPVAPNGGDKGQPPPVVPPDPGPGRDEPLPPMVALTPGEGTNFRAGGYEYLTDATRKGAQKWLDEQKRARLSVVWLDAYQAGDGPKFAAVSRLDSTRPEWTAQLEADTALLGHSRTQAQVIDFNTTAVLAISSYRQERHVWTALLSYPGANGSSALGQTGQIAGNVANLTSRGRIIRQLRPFSQPSYVYPTWAFFANEGGKDKGFFRPTEELKAVSAEDVTKFLTENDRPGWRPGPIAACEHNGKVVYGATVFPDGAAGYEAKLALTADELKAKCADMANAGFVPTSLTGYSTKEGSRFCAVWVKYAPEPKAGGPKPLVALEPKDGRVVAAEGCEYLFDATHTGAKKWLDAHRGKHSVLWFVAYQAGEKPRFAGVVVLDARQKDWTEVFGARSEQLAVPGLLQVLTNAGLASGDRMLVSASEYTDGGISYTAVLCRRAPPSGLLRRNVASFQINDTMKKEIETNRGVMRDVRPVVRPVDKPVEVMWQFAFDRGSSDQSFARGNLDEKELTEFLTEYGARPGLRVGSIAACEFNGKVLFGAAVYTDKFAVGSAYRVGLTADALAALAPTMAKDGFVPTALNPYGTKDGVRFCAVWVKYPPPKKPGALDPKEGTVVAVAGHEYLIGATKDFAQKWLAAHKAAKHSVTWLDGYDAGGRGAFCALAALDDRQPKWEAFLDTPHLGFDPKRLIDTKTHTLVSLSAYYDVGVGFSKDRVASLWHPGTRQSTLRAQSDQLWVEKDLPALERGDTVVRQVRPSLGMPRPQPFKETRYWSWHYCAPVEGEKGAHVWGKSRTEVAAFLAKHHEPGTRPGSVSACVFDGEPVYGATVFTEPGVTDWVAELDLSATDLKAKAGELGAKAFVPVSLTGCRTKDGVRFCAVWVKYGPAKKP